MGGHGPPNQRLVIILMMQTSANTIPKENAENANFGIVVDSIGNAGIGLVQALKKISPLSENKIAALLFQTPSILFSGLPEEIALEVNQLLLTTGLESHVIKNTDTFEPGDSNHEVAIVIKDFSRIQEIAKHIISLTGLSIEDVRKTLCKSPTVLIGKISQNTAESIRHRFKELNVDVDVSNPDLALFDVFKGKCSAFDQNLIKQILTSLGLANNMVNESQQDLSTLVCAGINREQADRLWNQLQRTSLPIKIVNRDFERFDLRLDQAPDTPEMIQYLTGSTGMPEKIARKVIQKLPVIIHNNIPYKRVEEEIAQLQQLGAVAIGHLLVFQSFSLKVNVVKNLESTIELLQVIGGVDKDTIQKSLLGSKVIEGPFTSPQVQWLQHELKKIGTVSIRILR